MAEDKTFRYGLIVLGFFLVMIGMFIMSVDKPNVYITFCTMGVFMVCVGITWSICQCYPKINFIPIEQDLEATEKLQRTILTVKPGSSTPYTSSKDAERYEFSLPSYEQIQIKVEECGNAKGDMSVNPFMGHIMVQPTLETPVEIHSEELRGSAGAFNGICQPNSQAPLASLKEDSNTTLSDASSNSLTSLQSCDVRQIALPYWNGSKTCVGVSYSCEGLTLIDSPLHEDVCSNLEPQSEPLPNYETITNPNGQSATFFIPGDTQGPDVDDLYYGMKDEMDNLVVGDESDLEQ
ncbi:barttin [Discoglossus pictus]